MAAEAPADLAALDENTRTMPFAEGTLFRVTKDGLAPSYLFGTLHIVDPRLTLSAAARNALHATKRIVLESLDLGGTIPPSRMRQALTAEGARRASRLLTPEQFSRLATLLMRRGFPAALADRIKAPALALMLDLPACAAAKRTGALFLDAQVLGEARAASLQTIGLETTVEQVAIADDLRPDIETRLLTAVLAQADQAENVVETTVGLYGQGRTGMLLAWSRSPRPIPGVALAGIPPAFLDRIVDARSHRMRDRLLPILAQGAAFVAVGATHLPGQDGLAAMLVGAGYRVDKVE